MQYQRRAASGKVDKYKELEIQTFLQNVQRVLKPIKIINPLQKAWYCRNPYLNREEPTTTIYNL